MGLCLLTGAVGCPSGVGEALRLEGVVGAVLVKVGDELDFDKKSQTAIAATATKNKAKRTIIIFFDDFGAAAGNEGACE
jgi:hypothetical protein